MGRRLAPKPGPDPRPDLDSGHRTQSGPLPGTRPRSAAPPPVPAPTRSPSPGSRTPPTGSSLPGAQSGRLRSVGGSAARPRTPEGRPRVPRRAGSGVPRAGRSPGSSPLGRNSGRCGGRPLPPDPARNPRPRASPPALTRPVCKADRAGDAALRPAPSDRKFSHWSRDPARHGNRRRLDGCAEMTAFHWAFGMSVPAADRPRRGGAEAPAPARTFEVVVAG